MIEALYNKIDKFCNETDWSKYLTYEHALEEFIKEIVEEETKELEKENAELKEHLKCLIVGMYHIAQHHPTMGAHTKIMQDLREAEQFLKDYEVEK